MESVCAEHAQADPHPLHQRAGLQAAAQEPHGDCGQRQACLAYAAQEGVVENQSAARHKQQQRKKHHTVKPGFEDQRGEQRHRNRIEVEDQRGGGRGDEFEGAHAIPHFLGNNSLFSYDECDSCNTIFSKLEDSFAKFFYLGRTLSGIKGKNKIPTYNSPSKLSRIERSSQHLTIVDNINDPIVSCDIKNKSFKIKEVKQSHFPIYVYKSLVKIGLSVMDSNNPSKCKATIDWIKDINDNSFLGLGYLKGFMAFCPGDNPFEIAVSLVKRKENPNEDVPGLMLALGAANHFFQIVIPGYVDDSILDGKTVTFLPYPLLFPKDVSAKIQYKILDLSISEKVAKSTETHTVHFD